MKTDEEVIKAWLNVSDSRFQGQLLDQAKSAGKLATDYSIRIAFVTTYRSRMRSPSPATRTRSVSGVSVWH